MLPSIPKCLCFIERPRFVSHKACSEPLIFNPAGVAGRPPWTLWGLITTLSFFDPFLGQLTLATWRTEID